MSNYSRLLPHDDEVPHQPMFDICPPDPDEGEVPISIGCETGYAVVQGGHIVMAALETSEELWESDDSPRDDQEPEFDGPWPEPYDVRGDR